MSSRPPTQLVKLAELHHPDPPAVRTDPGRAIAEPPEILLVTLVADLKTAGAIPAERQHLPAAVTLEFPAVPPPLGI